MTNLIVVFRSFAIVPSSSPRYKGVFFTATKMSAVLGTEADLLPPDYKFFNAENQCLSNNT
jgi:hypothetical protein